MTPDSADGRVFMLKHQCEGYKSSIMLMSLILLDASSFREVFLDLIFLFKTYKMTNMLHL